MSSASFETCSNKVGQNVGERASEDDDKETFDMDDINFQDDGDKDITYVPGESEEKPRSVKTKGRF